MNFVATQIWELELYVRGNVWTNQAINCQILNFSSDSARFFASAFSRPYLVKPRWAWSCVKRNPWVSPCQNAISLAMLFKFASLLTILSLESFLVFNICCNFEADGWTTWNCIWLQYFMIYYNIALSCRNPNLYNIIQYYKIFNNVHHKLAHEISILSCCNACWSQYCSQS